MVSSLDVDGRRPAVAWVTSLPRDWTSEGERLVMLALACDAFEDVSAPGLEDLAGWTGMHRSSVAAILTRLCAADDRRPALLRRENRQGSALNGQHYGRERTRYRLLNRPASPDGSDGQPSCEPGRLQPSGEPGRLDAEPSGEPGRLRSATVAQPSPNRPASQDTPLPLPSSSPPSVVGDVTTERSSEEPRSEGSCPTCHRSRTACDRAGRNTQSWCPPWGDDLERF